MAEHPFEVVDVFTDRPFAGNQLAVVTDARGLDAAAMQAIAREFNFAESSFVLPAEDPANSARVRIFTPAIEMPFAGHPNVGTGFVLARMGELFGRPLTGDLRFEEAAGLVRVTADARGATVRAPRPLATGPEAPANAIAELAGIRADAVLTARFAPCFASVGAEFLFAEATPAALDAAAYDAAAFHRWQTRFGRGGLLGLHLHARRADGELEARMFAPLDGVPEDAATGSAAAALAALLAHVERRPQALVVHQGRHIGRPSRMEAAADANGASVGGRCAAVMRGVLTL